ncbi:hypothetical protein NPIL_462951 [Nephila pilipes]|uniref:Uncharacterized protein n=1 Tax=Nephila pilipes TaxID=299642 RepID=A0A8X6QN44_NEPPI|nr:hypothetical protein NPIL_462951 [Nephila pilipes]
MFITFSLTKLDSERLSNKAQNKKESPPLLYSKTFAVGMNDVHIDLQREVLKESQISFVPRTCWINPYITETKRETVRPPASFQNNSVVQLLLRSKTEYGGLNPCQKLTSFAPSRFQFTSTIESVLGVSGLLLRNMSGRGKKWKCFSGISKKSIEILTKLEELLEKW